MQAANAGNLVVLQDWISRLSESSDATGRFTRTFLAAINDASEEALNVLLGSGLVDVHAEDEINERNCLHEAAISGRGFILDLALERGVDASRVDVYGRMPLHYACTHGQVGMVGTLLKKNPETVNEMDHDNFTPLIHGIVHHQLACVKGLLAHGARIDPGSDADHVPLNLACQHGSVAIAELLLERKSKILPDAEGLFPQHLVARSGRSPDMLLMLERYGANLDQRDNLYQWTPLFHAATEGRIDCVQTLLSRNVDMEILDEKGLPAMYYATWEGHLECMKLLSSTTARQPSIPQLITAQTTSAPPLKISTSSDMSVDADGIPDLSLPPPIIPLRRYGHNFLDTKTFVQISFEEAGSDAILFYHDSKYPAARLTISSKLSDVIPRNIMLPIQEDFKIISFQIDNLDSFTVDFDIYPTFGSKIIAKSVALPNIFRAVASSSGHCCLPLFDPRLRAIGQISFNFQVIKPFHGIPLEITHFATYWKATSQLDSHPNAFITGSSLSGDYVQIFVQLTSDEVPVLYPRWSINHHGLDVPIARMTYEQFQQIGAAQGRGLGQLALLPGKTVDDITSIHEILANSFTTFRDVLNYLPLNIHVAVQVLYPTIAQEKVLGLSPSLNINNFADAILNDVFEHARITREQDPDFMRSMVFTSYNADICTALNWKQPNCKSALLHPLLHQVSIFHRPQLHRINPCANLADNKNNIDPVLLCNDLGTKRDPSHSGTVIQSSGHSSMSVKEAVRIAQSNNFMGLVCSSHLLVSFLL